jgi:hypothetical protein
MPAFPQPGMATCPLPFPGVSYGEAVLHNAHCTDQS